MSRARDLASARVLLIAARNAIFDELMAAGEDESRSHPTLRGHARVKRRIDRWLDAHPANPRRVSDGN